MNVCTKIDFNVLCLVRVRARCAVWLGLTRLCRLFMQICAKNTVQNMETFLILEKSRKRKWDYMAKEKSKSIRNC